MRPDGAGIVDLFQMQTGSHWKASVGGRWGREGHYNDRVHGTSQAPNKRPITKRDGVMNLPLLRFQRHLYTPVPDRETPWAAF